MTTEERRVQLLQQVFDLHEKRKALTRREVIFDENVTDTEIEGDLMSFDEKMDALLMELLPLMGIELPDTE